MRSCTGSSGVEQLRGRPQKEPSTGAQRSGNACDRGGLELPPGGVQESGLNKGAIDDTISD